MIRELKFLSMIWGKVILVILKCYKKKFCDFIFLCDQDDVWMENKVSTDDVWDLQRADLIVSDALICDGSLNPTLGLHFE